MSTTRSAVVAAVVAFVSGSGLGFGVGTRLAARPPPAPPTAARPRAEATARRVRMPAALRARAGVSTAPARRRPLAPTLDVVGSVDFDRDRVAEVGSRVEGRITRLAVRVGDAVRAGDALVELESAAVSEALAAYVSAQAAVGVARAETARLARLSADHLATAREVEQHHAMQVAREAELRGATQRLLASGMTPAEVAARARAPSLARITLRAPIAGQVVAREVVLGQVVEPTTTVLQIADPTRLWVQLEVFERDLARVAVGHAAEVTSDAHPDRVIRGTVAHVATSVGAATRTARVRIEVDNRELTLRPGQFVRARLRAEGQGAREAVTAPRAAVVQVEGRPAAFVEVADGEFELRPLELGAQDGDEVELVRGVEAGEALVVSGAFALKSELLR